jgi:ATP-dependent protease ClpP protease subunit
MSDLAQIQECRRRIRHARATLALDQIKRHAAPPPPIIPLEGRIDARMERQIRNALASNWDQGKILMLVNSPGGFVKNADGIVSDMRELSASGNEIEAIAGRICASAATDVFLAARYRAATPDSKFVLHETSFHFKDIKDAKDLGAARLRKLANLLEKTDKKSLADIEKRIGKLPPYLRQKFENGEDIILDATEAQALGLIMWTEPARKVEGLFQEARRAERRRFA